MPISMYQASVPVLDKLLGNLASILTKAAAWAETRKIDPAVLVSARLAPDMFALARQVQIACDFAKGAPARLAGNEPPKFEDNETTFADLLARIDKTRKFMATFSAAQIDGSEGRQIKLKFGPREMEFTGLVYLLNVVMPNFYFHYTMVYAILRHNGLELAKGDYLGA
jgi:uncharacterized protein